MDLHRNMQLLQKNQNILYEATAGLVVELREGVVGDFTTHLTSTEPNRHNTFQHDLKHQGDSLITIEIEVESHKLDQPSVVITKMIAHDECLTTNGGVQILGMILQYIGLGFITYDSSNIIVNSRKHAIAWTLGSLTWEGRSDRTLRLISCYTNAKRFERVRSS